MPAGRPTKYNADIATIICEKVASSTCGLKRLCEANPELPDRDTINVWRSKYPEFSAQYASAKLKQADLLAEEILEIADDASNDYMDTVDDDGFSSWKLNGEHVQRSRLRIDTRKWLAAKLLPRQYGDHAKQEDKSSAESALEQILTGKVTITPNK